MSKENSNIRNLIENQALIRGEVMLAAGEKSDYYYDIKKLLLDPPALEAITSAIFKIIRNDLGGLSKICSIGGMETGSIPLVTAISLRSGIIPAFYIRKQAKSYGLKKQIEGNIISPCLMVEDVITTGHSIMNAILDVEMQGVKVLALIAVVDRSKDNIAQNIEAKGIKYFSLYQHHH